MVPQTCPSISQDALIGAEGPRVEVYPTDIALIQEPGFGSGRRP